MGSTVAVASGASPSWRARTLDFQGPDRREDAETFRNFRFDVAFRNAATGGEVRVPGFFAADGEAAETGAASGSVWRVHVAPPSAGVWTFAASFRAGDDIAVSLDPDCGVSGGFMDGATGTFSVAPVEAARGERGFGGKAFCFTACAGLGGRRGAWPWAEDDRDGRAPSAAQDDDGAPPPSIAAEDQVFDVSMLAQWSIALERMRAQGVVCRMLLHPDADERRRSCDALSLERKLYVREMVARFSHHEGLVFDLGAIDEPSGARAQVAAYLRALDPYGRQIERGAVLSGIGGRDVDCVGEGETWPRASVVDARAATAF